jgi:hypothetical protein
MPCRTGTFAYQHPDTHAFREKSGLVALLLGSPLEFGSALAVCGTAWIVANFAERLAEEKHTHYRRTLTSTRRPTSSAVMPGYVCLRALARPDRCSATTP